MTDATKRIAWASITPLSASRLAPNGALASVDALRSAWQEWLDRLREEDRVAIHQRSLRRLAIETGIIERIYEVEWGLTLTLVAEGFRRDVIERANGQMDERTLSTLVAQRDSLQMVVDFVRDDRTLAKSFICELHAALTRTQTHHEVVDELGRPGTRPLAHGQWKTTPNHVKLEDGTVYECAPPLHVEAEMDRLLDLYAALERSDTHPLVVAAWLHHRFVQIHPFADGNGRVARALTLLVLEKHRYAPLVVDRFRRVAYMSAIASATGGDLTPLVTLFARLESAALASELDRPATPEGTATEVAHTLAAQLRARRQQAASQRASALTSRAIAVGARITHWFTEQKNVLRRTFADQGLADVGVHFFPFEAEKAHYFRGAIIDSAREAGHYADFGDLARWWNLRIQLPEEGVQLHFVAALHGAGRDTGVMAVTTRAQLRSIDADAPPDTRDVRTSADAFRFAYGEDPHELDARSAELKDLLDGALSVALVALFAKV